MAQRHGFVYLSDREGLKTDENTIGNKIAEI